MNVPRMTGQELAAARLEADMVNKKVNHGKEGIKGVADKDMFMKLLVTQLKYQDPTRPMEDREFIAQMAQFSTLEQMSNMNKEMGNLLKSSRSNEAFSLLGKQIDALNPLTNRRVSGVVSSIQYNGDEQVLMVNGEQVRMNDISAVRNAEVPAAAAAAYSNAAAVTTTINGAAEQKTMSNQANGRDAVPGNQ
ncbi:MAG TPA: flagellar hook capping FlgD N-terminal domain-containing protein [Spirochaetota bacterium]|nr:flagellar hook capping FlgD N-terminal domain-containing protein [Spirochaetota bacterium]HPV40034.1 flagellar hook capping FlgD N-terminal domain-containing protein [Spirochaetota bacterium]